MLSGEELSLFQVSGVNDGVRGRIPLLITSRAGPDATLLVVRDDSVTEIALRTVPSSHCHITDAEVTSDRVALLYAGSSQSHLVDCRFDSNRCTVVYSWGPAQITTNFAQDVFAARSHAAVHIVPAETAWRVDWDGAGTLPVGGWFADGVLAAPTDVASDATFFHQYGDRHVIRVSVGRDPGEPRARTLVEGVDFDALGLRTDGVDMVWHQGYERVPGMVNEFERVELWTSPFAMTVEELAPRRVAILSPRSMLFHYEMGFGRWADVSSEDATEIGIYDLRDGSRLTLVAPEGEIWWTTLYLGPEEIAVAPGREGSPGDQSTVMLVRYDSLGPPTPASP